MKMRKILKFVLITLLTVSFFNVMSQNPADFEQAALDGSTTSYVTVEKTMPFYVQPDLTYHPSWTAFSNNLTPNFTWVWTVPAGLTLTSQSDNYVTITANTVGDYVVNVKEKAPAAWGGCEDPTGVNITISVVDKPELHSFPMFASIPLNNGETYQTCAPYTLSPSIEVSGFPNFRVHFTLTQQALDINGNPTGVINTVIENSIVGGGNTLTRLTNQTYVFDADRVLDLITPETRTQYVYTITGITDNISRKSDYLGTETLYGTSNTFTFIVNPTPVTGPIYHIPNDFGNI
ncbi:hypothetical protein [Trichloromonas sp.]|uniref:hypothetical protein n=1 Tax=Trichloromonas sp. TaxID=3069249 RepID=UPI002A45A058|nr:hypothetical protein [Trichloromonas sp.]